MNDGRIRNFIERCRDGLVEDPEEEIHDAIDAWHCLLFHSPPLPEWLGMSEAHYAAWVEQRMTVAEIVAAQWR